MTAPRNHSDRLFQPQPEGFASPGYGNYVIYPVRS